MIAVQKLSDTLQQRGIKLLVYGGSGVGKTRLIASLPGRILVVSAEAGLLSLAGHVDDDRVDVVEVTTIAQLRDVYSALRAPGHGYDWVCLDSISEIGEVVLVVEKEKTKDPRAAYGELQTQMASLLRSFRDLPIGVYFSAKLDSAKDATTERTSYSVSMPGQKLGQSVPYLFDEVFRLVVADDGGRWLMTATDGRSVAKDRSGKLDAIEPADLGAIVAKIRGTNGGSDV